jgi:hypothetical protein
MEAVVQALLKKSSLTGDELAAILEKEGPPQPLPPA